MKIIKKSMLHMNIKKTLPIILLAFSLLSGSKVFAALVDLGDFSFDTVEKRSWLKVTETSGLSFNQVSAELDAGGDYSGWRYATVNDYESLLSSFGFSPASWLAVCDHAVYCGTLEGWTDDYSVDDFRAFKTLVETLGNNGGDTIYPYPQAQGYLADVDPFTGARRQGYLGIDLETPPPCRYCAFGGIYEGIANDDYARDWVGSFLVRDGIACNYSVSHGQGGQNNPCQYFRVNSPSVIPIFITGLFALHFSFGYSRKVAKKSLPSN